MQYLTFVLTRRLVSLVKRSLVSRKIEIAVKVEEEEQEDEEESRKDDE